MTEMMAADTMTWTMKPTPDDSTSLHPCCDRRNGGRFVRADADRLCPPLLTEAEAIRYLRLDVSGTKHPRLALRRYRRMGKLFGVKIGRQVLYRRQELDRFVERMQKERPR